MKITDEELIRYEAPLIADFISIGFLQDIVARYIAYKIKKKRKRYEYRVYLKNEFRK